LVSPIVRSRAVAHGRGRPGEDLLVRDALPHRVGQLHQPAGRHVVDVELGEGLPQVGLGDLPDGLLGRLQHHRGAGDEDAERLVIGDVSQRGPQRGEQLQGVVGDLGLRGGLLRGEDADRLRR
jgi:hypothetical protein